MRTIKTTSGTEIPIDPADPIILDVLDSIRQVLRDRTPDYDTEDAVLEIKFLVDQMSDEEAKEFLREFMQFAWLRYDEEIREYEAKLKRLSR